MSSYKLTNKAVNDLNKIWNYTFDKWSEKQADKYYIMLLNKCQEIATQSSLGKKYLGISEELFGVKADRHIIFYRVLKNKPIEISRILHNRMDLKNRITE